MKTLGNLVKISAFFISTSAFAQDVNITEDMARTSYTAQGTEYTIERNQDQEARIADGFAKTSRACPPFCIHAMSAGDGVETVGELELINFMQTRVAEGTGLLIDSRIPDWYAKGTIPGAVNVPFSTLSAENPYRDQILTALGGLMEDEAWDFSEAMDLTLFCNGPWCDQSPRAIQNLLAVGYPAEKIRYYRGGMQLWLLLGLNTAAEAQG